MTSVLDNFLDDLDELGDEDDKNQVNVKKEQKPDGDDDASIKKEKDEGGADDDDDAMMDFDADDDEDESKSALVGGAASVSSVAQLSQSSRYADHMKFVEEAKAADVKKLEAQEKAMTDADFDELDNMGDDEGSEGVYDRIVSSNKLLAEIREEVMNVHRYVVELYSKKFPELESLVPGAMEYMAVVKAIGNEMDMTKIDLSQVLPSAQVMVVTVTGSTTSGQPLPQHELDLCLEGCAEGEKLDMAYTDLLWFVESKMSAISPNVCNMIGSALAAQVVGLAGGLEELSQMPACNVLNIGNDKNKMTAGFGANASQLRTGLIFHSELVQICPPIFRQKAVRVLSAKLALAARLDVYQRDTTGEQGKKWKEEIEEKIEKWQEPPKNRTKKAMKRPDDYPATKRGGKRHRKQKERLEMTDVRKEQNRRTFASEKDTEYGDDAMGFDTGMLGKNGSNKLKVKVKETKITTKKLRAINAGTSGVTSGLSSSLAFTPVQGIELVNPVAQAERERKVREANKSYFSNNNSFHGTKKK